MTALPTLRDATDEALAILLTAALAEAGRRVADHVRRTRPEGVLDLCDLPPAAYPRASALAQAFAALDDPAHEATIEVARHVWNGVL